MADYWMKLYIEILDDPKMAVLPDRIWRRIVELFLVAKKLNKDGHLPETRQIAWLLRMNPDELELDMMQIAPTGIIVKELNGWFIPNFAKRQAASDAAERQQQRRKRLQSQQYYENVTDESRNVTERTENREQINREQKTETEAEQSTPPTFSDVQTWLEQTTGLAQAGKAIEDMIDGLVKLGVNKVDVEKGAKWYIDNNKKGIRYITSLDGPIKTEHAKRIQAEAKGKQTTPPKQYEPVMVNGEMQFREVSI